MTRRRTARCRALSYAVTLAVTVNADAAVSDPDVLAAGIANEFAEGAARSAAQP